jgi:hypothetical protein
MRIDVRGAQRQTQFTGQALHAGLGHESFLLAGQADDAGCMLVKPLNTTKTTDFTEEFQ